MMALVVPGAADWHTFIDVLGDVHGARSDLPTLAGICSSEVKQINTAHTVCEKQSKMSLQGLNVK